MQSYSLGEGHTPFEELPSLAQKLGLSHVYIKDETKNPSGSFKDRATVSQLTHWAGEGKNAFVISSSGNAAVSLALYCKRFGLRLDIFLAHDTEAYKLQRLDETIQKTEGNGIVITHFSRRPKKEAFQFAMQTGAVNLLHSKDDYALEGYISLGQELLANMEGKNIQECQGIFVPTSSGTGILGIAKGMDYHCPFYAIQTTKMHPISELYDTDFVTSDTSLASGIAALFTSRKQDVVDMINKTGGGGYVICDEELESALQVVKETTGRTISYDSALSIAGLTKAIKKGKIISTAICILTGI